MVGALLGGFLAGMLGLGGSGFVVSLIIATIGAILLLVIVGLVRRKT